jgi:hypothetical protein
MQRTPDTIEDIAFIVDEENTFHAATALGARVLPSRGRRMMKVVPVPASRAGTIGKEVMALVLI